MKFRMFKILMTMLMVTPFPSYGFWIDNKPAVPLRGATVFRLSPANKAGDTIDWEKVLTTGTFNFDSGARRIADPPAPTSIDASDAAAKIRGTRDTQEHDDTHSSGSKRAIASHVPNDGHSTNDDVHNTNSSSKNEPVPEQPGSDLGSKVMIGSGIFVGLLALVLVLFYVLPWKKNSSGSRSAPERGEDQPEGRLPPATVSLIGSGYKPRAEREAERAAAAAEAARTGKTIPKDEGHYVPVWQPLPSGPGAPKHGKGLPSVHDKKSSK